MGYLANFMVYTFAMVGVIVVALLIFKQSTSIGTAKNSKHLKLIDTMSLGQRKMLYIVSAGQEKFLIAGDTDRTTLISKLNSEIVNTKPNSHTDEYSKDTDKISLSFQNTLSNLTKPDFSDKTDLGIRSSILTRQKSKSVIRNLAEKIMK